MALAMIELTDENGNALYLNLDDIMAIVRVPEGSAELPELEETDGHPAGTAVMSRIILRGGFPAQVYGTPESIVANFQAPAESDFED